MNTTQEAILPDKEAVNVAGKIQFSGNYRVPLSALITLFFMWGFITCMNDILIPHLKILFQLNYLQSMLVQFCFFGAYFTGSLIYFLVSYYRGDAINKIGYKKGIVAGLFISVAGCLLFYPATIFSAYWIFLAALFILGLGFTLLQITANVYVALLGAPEGASSRLNLAQAFNSLGTTMAPIIGGVLIFGSTHESVTAGSSKLPYLVFAVVFVAAAILICIIRLPVFKSETAEKKGLGAWSFPQLRLGVFGIFCYVGAEVAIGSLMISLLKQANIMNLPEPAGKNYLAIYWGGAMIGRFLGAISLNRQLSGAKKIMYMALTAVAVFGIIFRMISLPFTSVASFIIFLIINLLAFIAGRSAPARTLLLFALINIALVAICMYSDGKLAMWAILSVGLFNSIMWSNIFTLSISGLGKHTNQGSSLLIMAILGGALIPLLQG
ncbi:sugar MFS transporter, partial [Parafilimonas sp.]|uniref:sugar MFS transporter n=1 Tax=Parafilimonas sp. TaxID=1969739 RepID=UPI0039E26A8C